MYTFTFLTKITPSAASVANISRFALLLAGSGMNATKIDCNVQQLDL